MNHTKTGIKVGWSQVALFIVVYIICSILASLLLSSIASLSPTGFTYLLVIFTGIISIILVRLFGYRFDKPSFVNNLDDSNVEKIPTSKKNRIRDAFAGLLFSAGLVGTGAFAVFLTGSLQWSVNEVAMSDLLMPALLMVWVAFYEELVFRGFILENLFVSFPKPVALLISAGIFAIFHAFNPGTSIVAIINIFTGGILIGLTYMYNRNLWLPVSFHFGWNYIQGPVLGFPVSGIQLPSILNTQVSGSVWINGGDFGFEASVFQLPVVLIGVLLLLSSGKQN